MAKLEQELVNEFIAMFERNALRDKKQCSFTQIESGATAIGIPDLLLFYDGAMYWIECKVLRSKVAGQTTMCKFTGDIHFRPGQLRFLRKLLAAKEKAFILVLTEFLDVIPVPIADIPETTGAVYNVHHTGVDYTEAYNYLKKLLKE